MQVKQWKGWKMSCDVGEVMESLENEQSSQLQSQQSSFSNLSCHFTYITTHSPTLPSLYLHHSSFSNPSIASPTSQFILQPFFHFSYVTSSSLNSPGEPPMLCYVVHASLTRATHEKNSVCSENFKLYLGEISTNHRLKEFILPGYVAKVHTVFPISGESRILLWVGGGPASPTCSRGNFLLTLSVPKAGRFGLL